MTHPTLVSLLAALLVGACAGSERAEALPVDRPLVLSLEPPAPLDQLARAAATALHADPSRLTLAGANGLEQFGVRWEEDGWIETARAVFEARLADPRPLSAEEAEAFRIRWKEIDLEPRWRGRLEAEGHALEPGVPDPYASLRSLRTALAAEEPNRMLAEWGRIHAWFGHVWIDPGRAAIGYDGIAVARTAGGWQVADLLDAKRDYTVRRKDDHASLRQMQARGSDFLPDRLIGDPDDHSAAPGGHETAVGGGRGG